MADRYGVLVLVVEVMGASTVVLYGINLLFTPDAPVYEPDADRPGLPKAWPARSADPRSPCAKESASRTQQRCAADAPHAPLEVEEGLEGMLQAGRAQCACRCRTKHSRIRARLRCHALRPRVRPVGAGSLRRCARRAGLAGRNVHCLNRPGMVARMRSPSRARARAGTAGVSRTRAGALLPRGARYRGADGAGGAGRGPAGRLRAHRVPVR